MSNLPPHILKAFEAVVGADNVSDEDFVVNCHDWMGLGADPSTRTLLGKAPAAVVMPGSTEEVAGVVKVCNRYKLKFKAHSTGYGNYSGVGTKGSISIDLCRMKGLEIDPESRMAIIQPYTTAGELVSEAHKHQLMCHIIGAGPIHSPLASATSFVGVGVAGNHTSINSRNMLSLEWVTPEGEIVRIGSSGSDAGWFTGEGPGPGFRGMIRGLYGAAGGLGVFTKIGIKLYPWAGPKTLEWSGPHPYRGTPPPENFATYQLDWDNWEDATKATQMMKNSKAVAFINRMPPAAVGHCLTATNREYYDLQRAGKLPDIATKANAVGWSVTTMAWTKAQFDWNEAVLNKILAETNGRKMDISERERDILTAAVLTSHYVARFNRMGDCAGVSMGVLDSVNLIPDVVKRTNDDIGDKETKAGGKMMEVDTEQNWMWLSEGRHFWTENNPASTRSFVKNIVACVDFILSSFISNEKKPLGAALFVHGEASDLFGPKLGHANRWMRKVKNTWDPNNLSDSKHYIQPEAAKESKAWPIAKKIFFHPWGKPIFRKILTKEFGKDDSK
ncbi:FAD-binding oxidoreductase [Marinomonas mediterranea]|uniref:FAD-binding oxidoreductase n=1 Tax=Marinomonas mediterranea TaxID=119864 RepID=UPI00234A1C80|nr:FAD-binding oxidoreductase [Marinomonas mediterranea]WCN09411.1 FAD-binding protein [Marinomonas mediterranea]